MIKNQQRLLQSRLLKHESRISELEDKIKILIEEVVKLKNRRIISKAQRSALSMLTKIK